MIRRVLVGGVAVALSLAVPAGLARAPTATGRTIHVDCANTTGVEDGTAEHPYHTIQEGIDAAIDGDTVLVRPCTYYENIDFLGKAVTVTGTGPLDPAIVDATVIDGGGVGSVVTFSRAEGPDSVLTGFTITNGSAGQGGGIYCMYSSPTITNNTITANSASYGGGGIHCDYNATPAINNNDITKNNVTDSGGGIYCVRCTPVITNNRLTGNRAESHGGGIYCRESSGIIAGNTIADNRSGQWGGGIACSSEASPAIDNNTIRGNTARMVGGGISCLRSSPTITNNTIADNVAANGGGICCASSSFGMIANNTITGNQAPDGGGIQCCYESSPVIADNAVTANTAEISGGAIACWNSSPTIVGNLIADNTIIGSDYPYARGAGIACQFECSPVISGNAITGNRILVSHQWNHGGGIGCVESSPTITDNTISANSAAHGGGISCHQYCSFTIADNTISANTADVRGGGVSCYYYSAPAITGNIISGNTGPYGGGVGCEMHSSPSLANNVIAANNAVRGGGIFLDDHCSPAVTNCTIADNTATANGDGISCFFESWPTVCNSIVWNRIFAMPPTSIGVTYSDTLDCWPGEGNICADPQFIDPANGDYHLLPTSPCIDMGTNDRVALDDIDIDGQPRPWPPWGRVDMGADEWVPACDCDVAIDRTHCKMPAAGHVGQCKTGHIGAKNMSPTVPCEVVMRVTDNAGVVVFESEPVTIAPSRSIRLRFDHCYTGDEIGRNLWTWEVWPVECNELTPWDNVRRRRVNVQPGVRSSTVDWLPLWRL